MNDLITVIVPIFKVQKYLKKCVNSIIKQSYKNLEIILVDDGSPDQCGEICDYYARNDNRIKVIHKVNGGLSDARNVAIDIAQGKYITFIDGDDYVSKYYIENLYQAICQTGAKLSTGAYIEFENINELVEIVEHRLNKPPRLLNSHDCLKKMLYQDEVETCATVKMYHKDIFKTLRYPIGKLYEDVPITCKAIHIAGKVAITACSDYYYLQRHSSIQYQKFSPKKMDIIKHMQILLNFINKNYPDLVKAAKCRYFSAVCNLIFQVAKERVVERELLWNKVKKYRKCVLLNREARKKARVAAFLSYFGIDLMETIYRFTQIRGRLGKIENKY